MHYNEFQSEKEYLNSFEEWKAWVIQNKKIPTIHSENDSERKIAARHYYVLKRMKKESKKYSCYIREAKKLTKKYRANKSREENLRVWLKWCQDHNRLPKSNSPDKEEAKIAVNTMNMINRARRNPVLNFKIISKYESMVNSFKKPDHIYEIWKQWAEWVITNGRTPHRHSEDIIEDKLAANMASALQRARRNKEKYSDLIQNYEEVYKKYNPDRAIRKSKGETIAEWKVWYWKMNVCRYKVHLMSTNANLLIEFLL